MKLTFNEEDLTRILAKNASQALSIEITPDDILSFHYEADEDDVSTGVSIQFELQEKTE